MMVSPTKSNISDSPVVEEESYKKEVPTQESQQQPKSIADRRAK
jgi:hypothetical protein